MLKMTNIDVATQLGFIIAKLERAEEFGLANELSMIHLKLVDERTNAWNAGFNTGYDLGNRKSELSAVKNI